MAETLGERIRELRQAADLSLREFAKKLGGLSAAFISDIELGRRHPSPEVLARMAKVLRTSVEHLEEFDCRPPVEEIRRRSNADPAFGLALRRLVDQKVSPEELIKLVGELEERKGTKK